MLSCGRVSENHRGPEVPEEKVQVVECLDGVARITSKELAITRFVKSGTLQNACSTRPRVVVGLGRSAHMHTVRLMNSRLKGPKRMMTKAQLALLKKGDWHERVKSIPPNTKNGYGNATTKTNNDTSHETKRETNYSMNNKCNDVNTRNMHITRAWTQSAHFVTLCSSCLTCTHWLKSWVFSHLIHVHSRTWAYLLESLLFFYFDLSFLVFFFSFHFLHCCCTLSSTTWSPWKSCATPRTRWVRRVRRHALPHRLWAQLRGLQRAQRLFRFLLLHYTVIGPGHGWRDTRQAAHRGTPRTSRLLRTRRRVSQSVVVCCVR